MRLSAGSSGRGRPESVLAACPRRCDAVAPAAPRPFGLAGEDRSHVRGGVASGRLSRYKSLMSVMLAIMAIAKWMPFCGRDPPGVSGSPGDRHQCGRDYRRWWWYHDLPGRHEVRHPLVGKRWLLRAIYDSRSCLHRCGWSIYQRRRGRVRSAVVARQRDRGLLRDSRYLDHRGHGDGPSLLATRQRPEVPTVSGVSDRGAVTVSPEGESRPDLRSGHLRGVIGSSGTGALVMIKLMAGTRSPHRQGKGVGHDIRA